MPGYKPVSDLFAELKLFPIPQLDEVSIAMSTGMVCPTLQRVEHSSVINGRIVIKRFIIQVSRRTDHSKMLGLLHGVGDPPLLEAELCLSTDERFPRKLGREREVLLSSDDSAWTVLLVGAV